MKVAAKCWQTYYGRIDTVERATVTAFLWRYTGGRIYTENKTLSIASPIPCHSKNNMKAMITHYPITLAQSPVKSIEARGNRCLFTSSWLQWTHAIADLTIIWHSSRFSLKHTFVMSRGDTLQSRAALRRAIDFGDLHVL